LCGFYLFFFVLYGFLVGWCVYVALCVMLGIFLWGLLRFTVRVCGCFFLDLSWGIICVVRELGGVVIYAFAFNFLFGFGCGCCALLFVFL